ncbi:hypothetical protein SIN8267_00678 [Sinobacterium norvegicum]|uniref:YfaZ n=1 Tax=Sinobacterium norvegicum TaxID=1641715 RepID=A0ABN8EDR0_9GAMM|nr:YfaZ family outer membrane protein [Sinobacterium norvegicum]CAH0990584.1 hypothetical protein SIN8267_00678 [Sinobacterium norvegicum]
MLKKILATTLIAGGLVAANSHASDLGINISEHAAQFKYGSESDTMAWDGSWLYEEDNGSVFSGGLYAKGQEGMFSAKLGGRVFYADLDNGDGYGMALGGTGALHFTHQFRVEAGLHYAPSILSFSDIEGMTDAEIRAVFQVVPNASVSVGYRDASAKVEKYGREEIFKGFFFGMNMSF